MLPRFPELKFVSVESGIGWIPFVLEAVDHSYLEAREGRTSPSGSMLPSEYFAPPGVRVLLVRDRRHDAAARTTSPSTTSCSRPTSPTRRACTATSRERIEAAFAGVDDESRHKILWANAARLYSVDDPPADWAPAAHVASGPMTASVPGPSRFGAFIAPYHDPAGNPALQIRRDLELVELLDELGYDEVVVRRAPQRRVRDHRVARADDRRRGRAHEAHPARHRRQLAVVPPPVHPRRPHHAARPHDDGPRDARHGPGPAAVRRVHDGHRPAAPARHDDRGGRGDRPAAARRGRQPRDRLVRARRRPPAAAAVLARRHRARGGVDVVAHGRHARRPARAVDAVARRRPTPAGSTRSTRNWAHFERVSNEHGNPIDRSRWRVVASMHLAETREQAEREMEHGVLTLCGYFEGMGNRKLPWTGSAREALTHWTTNGYPTFGIATVGTPDDAIATIEKLSAKTGGFGTFLFLAHNCADWAATKRSYELFAEHVIPACRRMNVDRDASIGWVGHNSEQFFGAMQQATREAIAKYKTPN